ncbi:MAG: N-6 DNA methylase [Thermomicrobiales bacterium]
MTDHYAGLNRVVLPPSTALNHPHTNGAAPDLQKRRGGYYTPDVIGHVLAQWAIKTPNAQVLEPSAGDGQLVAAATHHLRGHGWITAVELYGDEAKKIAIKGGNQTTIVTGDFFRWFQRNRPDGSYDTVLGNPPFIRYQHFCEEHRSAAFALMREEGLHPSRLTNAWLPFVAVATQALRPGGRLALVLPAELLQVTYAAELREYLARKYSHLTVVTFRRIVFAGIQQETILLLGVRGDSPGARMSFVELDGLDDLCVDCLAASEPVEVDLDHAREKWTQYYLSPGELSLIRELEASPMFARLGQLAEIDVGIVTGRNDFFVLTEEEARQRGIREWCLPLVGRSAQIPGLILRRDEWERMTAANGKCLLLQLGNRDRRALSEAALSYVEFGERAGFSDGYKCRIRLPRWWNVPTTWVPDAFLLRQIYDGPRIILNQAATTCTDTIHRVRTRQGVDPASLAAASMNSLTYAFAEIRGRSYGGGVLELEPTEAEGLPFPKPEPSVYVDDLHTWARTNGVESTLAEVDRQVLLPTGLSNGDIEMLRGIWRKLYQRRMSRKRR